MSRKYCLSTSPKKMGFSQKASCKAQGLLKRSSKKDKGKYIISPKYRKISSPRPNLRKSIKKTRKRKQKSINLSLYSKGKNKPRVKTGYANKEKAKETIKNIKKYDIAYQKSVINTMYNRAKYYRNQTEGMRDAMKIYKKWLKKYKNK